VSIDGKLENWLIFFLKGLRIQADDALNRAKKLEEYWAECRRFLQKESQSTTVLTVLDYLFENPYIKVSEVQKRLGCHYPKAKYNVDILIKAGILQQRKGRQRGKIFFAQKIKEILED